MHGLVPLPPRVFQCLECRTVLPACHPAHRRQAGGTVLLFSAQTLCVRPPMRHCPGKVSVLLLHHFTGRGGGWSRVSPCIASFLRVGPRKGAARVVGALAMLRHVLLFTYKEQSEHAMLLGFVEDIAVDKHRAFSMLMR